MGVGTPGRCGGECVLVLDEKLGALRVRRRRWADLAVRGSDFVIVG